MTLQDRELDAMQEILQVLTRLDEPARRRVASWIQERVAEADLGSWDSSSADRQPAQVVPDKQHSPIRSSAGKPGGAESVGDLLDAGIIQPDEAIEWRRASAGQHHRATITGAGTIVTEDGRSFSSLSSAARAVADGSYNGWICWTVPRLGGVALGRLRGRSSGRRSL